MRSTLSTTVVHAGSKSPWPLVPLGEIADIKLGKMLDKNKPSTGRRLPYLRNINVRWGRVDTDDLLEMPFEDDQLDRFGLKAGDVLVCEGGEPGRAAVWDGHLPDLKFQKAIHRVRFKNPYEPRLLVLYLELLAQTGGLERRFTGSTIKHFTREAFVQLPVPLIPLRKEVTSTVLWLLKHDIRLQCFRATPFRHGDQVFLTLDQVIPLPEAAELMIGIAAKEKEEQVAEQGQATRYTLRMEFWHRTLESLEKAGVDLYSNVSPTTDHWLSTGSGLSGVRYSMIFTKDEARVELMLDGAKERNKALFDYLYSKRTEIENVFGATFDWRRMDEGKSSLIVSSQPFEGHNRASWPKMINWLIAHIRSLEKTFEPHIPALRQIVRSRFSKASAAEESEA